MSVNLLCGDAVKQLQALEDQSVNTCITSPPYFGLRDYGVDGQIGLEDTPEEYIDRLVDVFREVRRVLRNDGTLWIVIGDSYNGSRGNHSSDHKNDAGFQGVAGERYGCRGNGIKTLKRKDLIGIPWMLAFALRADGWYLRQDIIWAKKNPMPESVKDRCTRSHEYIFLLSKSKKYFFNHEAMQEEAVSKTGSGKRHRLGGNKYGQSNDNKYRYYSGKEYKYTGKRNKRDVWNVSVCTSVKDAHFAVYPKELIEPCILAGCPEGGIVLDPFCGSGTTGIVACNNNRDFIGIELNPEYIKIAERRLKEECV